MARWSGSGLCAKTTVLTCETTWWSLLQGEILCVVLDWMRCKLNCWLICLYLILFLRKDSSTYCHWVLFAGTVLWSWGTSFHHSGSAATGVTMQPLKGWPCDCLRYCIWSHLYLGDYLKELEWHGFLTGWRTQLNLKSHFCLLYYILPVLTKQCLGARILDICVTVQCLPPTYSKSRWSLYTG